jgi:hypothetical protein
VWMFLSVGLGPQENGAMMAPFRWQASSPRSLQIYRYIATQYALKHHGNHISYHIVWTHI